MRNGWVRCLGVGLVGLGLVCAAPPAGASDPERITLRGWFADRDCATSRVAAGRIGPTGQECGRKCLARGVPLAFIDERAKTVLAVDNPKSATALLGDHVEVVITRPNSRTLHVVSARILEKYAARCDAN